jgi:hypothetical protein
MAAVRHRGTENPLGRFPQAPAQTRKFLSQRNKNQLTRKARRPISAQQIDAESERLPVVIFGGAGVDKANSRVI